MQLEFDYRDPEALLLELRARTGIGLHLTLTDNASTVMSVRPSRRHGVLSLRLHHMFLHAGPEVLSALAQWVKSPKCRQSGDVLNAFIRQHTHLLRQRRPKPDLLRTRGVFFDLAELYAEVNDSDFDGAVNACITWGRRPAASRQRTIRFGSYTVSDNLIRIHPYLDQLRVPRFFIRFVVFHEMLHAYLGIEETETGRRRIHTAEFRRIEESHRDYKRAVQWEKNPRHIRRLFREGAAR